MDEQADQPEQADRSERPQDRRGVGTGFVLDPLTVTADEVSGRCTNEHDDRPLVETVGDVDAGHRDALVGDVEPAVDGAGFEAEPGKRGCHSRVVEDHLHQQRNVPQRLDPRAGDAAHQPVVRQAGQADDHAQDRGEEDAGNGQTQGVDHGGPEGPSTGVGVGVDSLTDLNVDGAFKEVEVGVDVPCPKVVPGLISQEPHGAEHHEQQEDLCHPLEDDDVSPQRYSLGYPLLGGGIRHR